MKFVELTQGKRAIVDDEDYDAVISRNWIAHKMGHCFYATRHVRLEKRVYSHEYMHRSIMRRMLDRDIVTSEMCDHVNGDGLDNRRSNLRLATRSQNNRNRHYRRPNLSSVYLGVCWHGAARKWKASTDVDGRSVVIGFFASEFEAAKARDKYIADPELMARPNFAAASAFDAITGDSMAQLAKLTVRP